MIRSLSLAALLASPVVAFADPPAGQIDPTFNDGEFESGVQGLQIEEFDLGFSLDDLDDEAYAIAQDAAGRLIVAGVAETNDGYCLGLMRFTSDGQLDTKSFGFNANQIAKGKICHSVLAPGVDPGFDLDIATLPDGGFLVGGSSSDEHPYACRFLADGRKMDSFGAGTGCTMLSQIESGGSILAPSLTVLDSSVFITANHFSGVTFAPVVARIAIESGEIKSFGANPFVSLLSSNAFSLAVDTLVTDDGDLMVVGQISSDANNLDAFVARFDLQTFQPDLGFSEDGIAAFDISEEQQGQDYFSAVALLADGDILAAGGAEAPGDKLDLAIVQLDATTGETSTTFNGGLPKAYDPCIALDNGCEIMSVNSVAQAAGHIVVSGGAHMPDGLVLFAARLSMSGAVDNGFGMQGIATIDLDSDGFQSGAATGMALQGDRIVLAGSANNGSDENFALVRLSGGRLFKDEFEVAVP